MPSTLSLFFDHDHSEGSGEEWGAAAAGRGGAEFSGGQEDAVIGVEPHVAGASGSLDRFEDVVRVGAVLMDDGESAVGVRGEGVGRGGVVTCAIDASADGKCSDDLAGLIVGHGHDAAAAAAEETVVGSVEGHRDGLFAGCGGPAAVEGRGAGKALPCLLW